MHLLKRSPDVVPDSTGIDSTSLLIAFLRALQPHWRPGEGEGRCRGTLDPQGAHELFPKLAKSFSDVLFARHQAKRQKSKSEKSQKANTAHFGVL